MNWTVSDFTSSHVRLVMEKRRGSNRFGEGDPIDLEKKRIEGLSQKVQTS